MEVSKMNKILKSKIIEKFGTQFDFAIAVQMHESDVSRIIRGRREPTPETRKQWAAVLGVGEKRIFGNKD